LAAAIKALKAGENPKAKPEVATKTPEKIPATEAAKILREVVDQVVAGTKSSDAVLTITYVDTHGISSDRLVEPIRFEGGLLTGFDLTDSRIRDYAISRIAGVAKGKK